MALLASSTPARGEQGAARDTPAPRRGKLLVITGPSGVGKGTLIQRLLRAQPELDLSVSATTRDPRPGEQDGVHYRFLDDAEFDRRVGAEEFLEHARYAANRYGTLRSEVEPRLDRGGSVVLEIEVQGARQVREAMPEAVTVFIAPPSAEDLRRRLEGRGTDPPAEIERRLDEAARELKARGEFGHVVVNDDVDAASARLLALVQSQLSA